MTDYHPTTMKTPRQHAHAVVTRAVKSGELAKPAKCSACGRGGRVDGHHTDYSEPLLVIWLCKRCHRQAHIRRTYPPRPVQDWSAEFKAAHAGLLRFLGCREYPFLPL